MSASPHIPVMLAEALNLLALTGAEEVTRESWSYAVYETAKDSLRSRVVFQSGEGE